MIWNTIPHKPKHKSADEYTQWLEEKLYAADVELVRLDGLLEKLEEENLVLRDEVKRLFTELGKLGHPEAKEKTPHYF